MEGTEASSGGQQVGAPGQDREAAGGPTVLRMLLGAHLRRLREAKGVSREDAGWHIRGSESKISRMELGRVGFKERDITDLLTLYGIDDEQERDRLLTLARSANSPGWWHRYGDMLPNWFQPYLGLEAAATQIRTYELQFVPGLLQTRDYARAVTMLGHRPVPDDEIERRVDLRMTRQHRLSQPNPVHLWAVVDEAVLHRVVGGLDVMRSQIEALIKATMDPNITVQIVPFRVGGHAAGTGAFSILRFSEQDLPDIVYIEQLTSALYLDKRDDVDHYAAVMDTLCVQAESAQHTIEILQDTLRGLD
jgi:Domain of unknown function (DUF5753)/Helix-turn-helix domain